mmetsp:Transcript_34157/g.53257  ORF Transcript_34157/g.53257 Transcript_34157/m.53257 type:complete len:147 (-) Transcript_34157:258-698(-)
MSNRSLPSFSGLLVSNLEELQIADLHLGRLGSAAFCFSKSQERLSATEAAVRFQCSVLATLVVIGLLQIDTEAFQLQFSHWDMKDFASLLASPGRVSVADRNCKTIDPVGLLLIHLAEISVATASDLQAQEKTIEQDWLSQRDSDV